MTPRVVAGVGAAVVAAGVSLGGPIPVAAADDTNAATAAEARSQTPGPTAPSRRPARGRFAAEPAATTVAPAKPAPRAGQVRDRNTAASVTAPRKKPAQRPLPAPAATDRSEPMPAAIETIVTPAAPRAGQLSAGAPAALRRPATERAATPAFPVIRQAVGMTAVNLERTLDTLGIRLSGRAGRFSDVLAGGLWLVRRTLFPVGADVGLWGSAACVATKDCSGQDLTGADFTGQDLTKVNFTNAVLRSAVLREADLTEADLTGAAITNANFNGATLVKTTLAGVSDADLISANWSQADLSGQDFSGRRLDGGFGRGIGFYSAVLTDAKFINTSLARASFLEADLTRADFTGAVLVGSNLHQATLIDAKLINANLRPGSDRRSPTLVVEANLTGADLTGARLDGNDTLDGTNLSRSNLTDANLTQANLAGAKLYGVNLTDANLTRANLAGAKLYGVTWKNTTCPDGSKSDTGCSGSAPAAGAGFGSLVAGVGRVLSGVAAGVDRVLGAASQWLSSFPGPVASFLVGALDRVRQSLKDDVVGLPGWSVSGTSVEVKNQTDQVLVLRQDPDGIRGGSQREWQVFLSPGQNWTFSGTNQRERDGAVDVLLSVNLAKKVGEDWIATDETRMVLVANDKAAFGTYGPLLMIEAVDPPSLQDGQNLNRAYIASRPSSRWGWVELSEGEDCYCDAVNSGGPADGPRVYVGRRDDSDDYKNFYVEIFSVGATPTGGGKDMYPVNPRASYYCNGKGAKER